MQTTIDTTAAVERYAQSMLDIELAHQREYRPERLERIGADELVKLCEQHKELSRQRASELAANIIDRNWEFCDKIRIGTFHPANKVSRRLFTDITGVSLPHTVSGTREALHAYAGQAWAEFVAAHDAAIENQKAHRAAIEAEKQAAVNESIFAKLRAGESVSGDELVDACRALGVPVRPNTVGMLRKRVHAVNSKRCQFAPTRTNRKIGYTQFDLYKACVTALSERDAV